MLCICLTVARCKTGLCMQLSQECSLSCHPVTAFLAFLSLFNIVTAVSAKSLDVHRNKLTPAQHSRHTQALTQMVTDTECMLVTQDQPDVLVPSSELALYAIPMPLPGLLPLPVRGLLPEAGEELPPCLAAARKLRCTLTCTVASA